MTDLEYLTVDSVQWATGYVRPRMPLEEKRAKHRVHQRQFTLRQQQRIAHLQREIRRYSRQLELLEATREASTLIAENEALQHQFDLRHTPLTTGMDIMPFKLYCEDSTSDLALEECEEAAIQEVLDMLPDVHTIHVDSPSDIGDIAWCQDAKPEPPAWPTSPSDTRSFQKLLGCI